MLAPRVWDTVYPETPRGSPKGPCTSMVHTWALEGVPVSLLWGLRMHFIGYLDPLGYGPWV